MTTTIVEIPVPLLPAPAPALPRGVHPYPWTDQVVDFLADLEDEGGMEVHDEGEEHGDAYVFFVTGAEDGALLAAASRVAALPGVPAGAFAVVSDDEAEELGRGRRVALPLSGREGDGR